MFKGLAEYDIQKGVYRIHNGLEFKTLDEVKAFKVGVEYARANSNAGIDVVLENTLNGLKEVDITY